MCPLFERVATAGLVGLMGLMAGLACEASPPSQKQGPEPALGSGPFASIARCSPVDPNVKVECPGQACADNVTGEPDGKTIDLHRCGTLDVVFTSGTLLSFVSQPDLAIHVRDPVGGQTRVEASEDGLSYELVGFIAETLQGTPPQCLAKLDSGRVLVDFAPCNLVSNVSFLRLRYEPGGMTQGVTIDAVEALSFAPR